MDDHVDVRGDEPLPVRVVRIGARQHRAARQDRGEAAHAVRSLGDDAIADGQRAFLPRRDFRGDDAVELAAVVEDAASSAGDADHHRGVVHVDVAGAGVAQVISHCLHAV